MTFECTKTATVTKVMPGAGLSPILSGIRPPRDARDPDAAFMKVGLASLVRPDIGFEGATIVTGEEEEGILAQALLLQPIDDATQVSVHLSDGGEVAAQQCPARHVVVPAWRAIHLPRVLWFIRNGPEGTIRVVAIVHTVWVLVAPPRAVRGSVVYAQVEGSWGILLVPEKAQRVVHAGLSNIA